MGVEIAKYGPRREVVIDGWTVPLLSAFEADGGKIELVIDRRMGVSVDADHFDRVVTFIADVIGVCWGYGAHPRGDDFDRSQLANAPHPSLAPQHMVGIASIATEDETE